VVCAFGRNPLLRRTDRIEAIVTAVAIIVAAAVIPIAAAVGAAVYDAHAQLYADEAQTRHSVAATVIESNPDASQPQITTRVVRATWRAGGAQRTDWFLTDRAAKVGDLLNIWVTDAGERAPSPTPISQAGIDAVGAGAGLWCAVALALMVLATMIRSPLNRIRCAQWERELKSLAGGGRPNRAG
jgi:hypothetical protein